MDNESLLYRELCRLLGMSMLKAVLIGFVTGFGCGFIVAVLLLPL